MPTNSELPRANMRFDPYRHFQFRVKWDGRYVAGVSKVSALTGTTDPTTHPSGGDSSTPRRVPGQSEFAAITLEKGVTHDVEFEQWVNKVWDHDTGRIDEQQGGATSQDVSLYDFRKDIVLEVYDEAGKMVIAYNIYRCWPSEFTAFPELDGNGNAVAIQLLRLENEGWERDSSIAEPAEPSFTLPAS